MTKHLIPDSMNRKVSVGDFEWWILPHPDAPTISEASDKELQTVVGQLIAEILSPNMGSTEDVRRLLKEFALTNLWFFLKYIAGFSGPYELLNTELHLEMCNFRQSEHCMKPGAKSFSFIPRGMFKSTILSHGADGWELFRNPNLKIALINAVLGKAQEFMGNIQRMFDSNEFLAWLAPEVVPPKGHRPWNNEQFVMPNRTRNFPEPSVRAIGATGAVEGGHFDLQNYDDLHGLDDLDMEMKGSASMENKKRFFLTNSKALRFDEMSRINGVATRYAIDDTYQIPMDNAKIFLGYHNPEHKVNPNGDWSIYYRMAVENDEAIFPEVMSKKSLAELAEHDFWTYITQYMNDPQQTGLAEFFSLPVKMCRVFYSEQHNDLIIERLKDTDADGKSRFLKLGWCDVVMSVDPAGTDTGITAKTSRSSVGIWAKDWNDHVYRIWEKVDYMDVLELFDAMFEGHARFPGYIRETVVESNAMQKILQPLLEEECRRRGTWINPKGIPARGDKDARIRNIVGSYLFQEKLWLAEGYHVNFIEEKQVFPMSKVRKDVLDESEKGISALRTPASEDEINLEIADEVDKEAELIDNVVGY